MKRIFLTQYRQPHGIKKTVYVDVPDDIAAMAGKQVLSCERAPNGIQQVWFYSRKKDWDEEDEEIEIVPNSEVDRMGTDGLQKLIRRVDGMTKPANEPKKEIVANG